MGTPNAKRLMLTITKQTIKDFLFKTKSTRNELKYISKLEKKIIVQEILHLERIQNN